MKNRGFTDKCFLFFTAIWIMIIVTSIVLTCIQLSDLSVINTIVEKSTEAMMTYIGFNIWKTKAENMKKMDRKDSIEM